MPRCLQRTRRPTAGSSHCGSLTSSERGSRLEGLGRALFWQQTRRRLRCRCCHHFRNLCHCHCFRSRRWRQLWDRWRSLSARQSLGQGGSLRPQPKPWALVPAAVSPREEDLSPSVASVPEAFAPSSSYPSSSSSRCGLPKHSLNPREGRLGKQRHVFLQLPTNSTRRRPTVQLRTLRA